MRALPYKPKAYVVPPVVIEANMAQHKAGKLVLNNSIVDGDDGEEDDNNAPADGTPGRRDDDDDNCAADAEDDNNDNGLSVGRMGLGRTA